MGCRVQGWGAQLRRRNWHLHRGFRDDFDRELRGFIEIVVRYFRQLEQASVCLVWSGVDSAVVKALTNG